MEVSRKKKTAINTTTSFVSQIILIALGFISRRVLIYSVGVQYLGINGLMTNILTVFSLAESGIGLAIGYALYKPLADHDIETVKSLMRFYKVVYRMLAVATVIIGLLFYPFYPLFLKGNTAPDVNIIYWICVFSSTASYLWSYKATLNNSDQNSFLYTIANTVSQILVLIIKIFILYFTENYVIYLSIDIGITIVKNIIFSRIVDRKYPFLNEKNVQKIPIEIKEKLVSNVSSLFLTKVGYIVSTCSDNLVAASIINITAVGLYSNYGTIISSIRGFVSIFIGSVTASMGNLFACESKEYSYEVFKKIDFINYFMYSISATCLLCLIEPFIAIWLGDQFLLSKDILILAIVLYFIIGISTSIDTARSAAGLFRADRYITLIEAVVNLGISIILAKKIGLSGVIAGTIISRLTCSFWVRAKYVYKNIFEVKFKYFFIDRLKKVAITVLVCSVTFGVQLFVTMPDRVLELLIKTLVCGIVSVALMIILCYKMPEFQSLMVLMNEYKRTLAEKVRRRIQ